MENYCSNFVMFIGELDNRAQIEWLFRAISSLENIHHCHPNPHSMGRNTEDIKNVDFLKEKIYFETLSSPNIDLLTLIAEYYQCDFLLEYHDFSQALIGQAIYENGKLNDIRLELEDLQGLNYELDINAYQYQEKYYRSDAEILEFLLQNKINQENNAYKLRR